MDIAHARLPPPFSSSPPAAFTLISQGAEAIVFKTTFLFNNLPVALKFRPPKLWRHATLDRRLTRQRILAEARVLVKCRRDGVPVPTVLGLDLERGWMATEWISGITVKEGIRQWRVGCTGPTDQMLDEQSDDLKALLHRMGQSIGLLHSTGVVHGDLTTSNMMLRSDSIGTASNPSSSRDSVLRGDLVLIDFGLSTQTVQDEDRAVDLYVLERAFGSTHPKEEDAFRHLLNAYAGSFQGAKTVLRRLEDVRMRGRKKSMLG